jgi:hypothetical protein
VGELAVRAVDLAPLVVERHDLGHLVLEQAVHGTAAGAPVGQLAGRSPVEPAVGPHLAEFQLSTRSPPAPAGISGFVEQAEQGRLGGLVDSARDPATQPQ